MLKPSLSLLLLIPLLMVVCIFVCVKMRFKPLWVAILSRFSQSYSQCTDLTKCRCRIYVHSYEVCETEWLVWQTGLWALCSTSLPSRNWSLMNPLARRDKKEALRETSHEQCAMYYHYHCENTSRNVYRPAGTFLNSGLKIVFEKPRFCVGLVWTVGLTRNKTVFLECLRNEIFEAQQVSCCSVLLRWKFLVTSLKNTASMFPEIFFIQYFTILVASLVISSLP